VNNHSPTCPCYMCNVARSMDEKLAKLVYEIPGPDTPEPDTIDSLRDENAKLKAERDRANAEIAVLLTERKLREAERDDWKAEHKRLGDRINEALEGTRHPNILELRLERDALARAVAGAEVAFADMDFTPGNTADAEAAYRRFQNRNTKETT
jgi:septal ring factor EnvC (AmiA/AmiB activator)